MQIKCSLFVMQVKQRCAVLEDQLVDLVIVAMERSEELDDLMDGEDGDEDRGCSAGIQLWQHLSSQLIFFVLFQFSSFPHMVLTLYDKVRSGGANTVSVCSLTDHSTYCSIPASTVIGAIGGASLKPGNGEDCVRKGIHTHTHTHTSRFYGTATGETTPIAFPG
jgi:hypothetical protein